ncbi:hypothetical protein GY21_09835 [Cryobacterium roopkundense]|uniref:Uncharacterized protein n=1 Tax=Cryobacterium roopkundense TaxID=1001240 RepID=A0A099JD15_9MICO|nr:hypothetical protein [Cryobacterium roopkundense]KGJ75413.1 hypothetical protein GY21_09835 [Cryobacterium roopkundense]MBB5639929.1 hypothetical protein [Cryobacterium roopkundense]
MTDFAAFKARLEAEVAGASAHESVGALAGFASRDELLKPLPLKTPPATPMQVRLRVDLADS